MKAVSILAVALVLGAWCALGAARPAMAQCVPDIPTGSALQPQPAGDDASGPGARVFRPTFNPFLHFPLLAAAPWSPSLAQLGARRGGSHVTPLDGRRDVGRMNGRAVAASGR